MFRFTTGRSGIVQSPGVFATNCGASWECVEYNECADAVLNRVRQGVTACVSARQRAALGRTGLESDASGC